MTILSHAQIMKTIDGTLGQWPAIDGEERPWGRFDVIARGPSTTWQKAYQDLINTYPPSLRGSLTVSEAKALSTTPAHLQGPAYQVKIITVSPNQRLSLQRHRYRVEHWHLISGVADVVLGESVETMTTTRLTVGEHIDIPWHYVHRLVNAGSAPVVVLEAQHGLCLEDDIERLQDDFQRVKS